MTRRSRAQDDPNRALTLLTAASQSPWAVLVDIVAVGGLVFGPVLLAVGLWRRRATSGWVPIALLLYTGVTSIPGGAPPSGTYQWRTSSQALAVASSGPSQTSASRPEYPNCVDVSTNVPAHVIPLTSPCQRPGDNDAVTVRGGHHPAHPF